MENRIELELRGQRPSEVTELNLDNCRATTITGLTDEFTALEALSVINVGLTSLKGLPSLPSLKRLEVSENRISGNLEHLHSCPAITHLNLSGNRIKDLESLQPLTELKDLISLDLFNCDVSNLESYREEVFKVLPSLKYLDGYDVNGEEAESDDDDIIGEGDEDSGDEGVDDEGSEVGLEYLQSSTVMQDEDETEDFAPEDDQSNDADSARGTKRKHEEEED